jgi:hypothetical protein
MKFSLYLPITFVATLLFLSSETQVLGQSEKPANPATENEFTGFSGSPVSVKSTSRGATLALEDLEAFSSGNIKTYNFQTQYKKVFLGNDFYDVAITYKTCDSLKRKLGQMKSHFIPVSDGKFFKHSVFTKIEELNGFYKFKNSKNLPGIIPNVDLWVKMETYKNGKNGEKNCLVLKFLIPENVNDKIENKEYVMRNDGILVAIPAGTDPDFSLKMDFNQYCLHPLNDPTGTTHLIGKDFTVLGSFAQQQQCENVNGLLFPTTRKGEATGCVFFRKSSVEMAPKF